MCWSNGKESYGFAKTSDLGDIEEMLSDPEVGRWLWFTPAPPAVIRDYFTPFLATQQAVIESGTTPQTAVFIVHDQNGHFLGQGATIEVPGSPRGFEIGFQLGRHAWGRGVGGRLGQFLVAYAVTLCNAYRIEASCLEGNVASAKILTGLGLEREGQRPGYRVKEDQRHTELLFGAPVDRLDLDRFRRTAQEVGLSTVSG